MAQEGQDDVALGCASVAAAEDPQATLHPLMAGVLGVSARSSASTERALLLDRLATVSIQGRKRAVGC